MKNSIKISAFVLTLFVCSSKTQAQVGIGVATPHASSILDMTNTDNKGILFPKSTSKPSSLSNMPAGMLFYYDLGLYMRDTIGFNRIDPWKYLYNGAITQDISFNPSALVGVGIGVNTGSVLAYLHVNPNGKDVNASNTNAAIMIGNKSDTTHMLIDADEIMVKKTASTAGILKLQDESGGIRIGSATSSANDSTYIMMNVSIGSSTVKNKLNVVGDINTKSKIKENGNDLLPVGSIILWSGPVSSIPAGWGLCNGAKYHKVGTVSDSIVSPNLSGRSIIAPGSNGVSTYSVGTSSGADSVALVTANLPQHQHTGTTNVDGKHQHTGQENALADNDDFDGTGYYIGGRGGGFNNDGGNGFILDTGSDHSHAFTTGLTGCTGCNSKKVDVRSAYYVLAYIIKL